MFVFATELVEWSWNFRKTQTLNWAWGHCGPSAARQHSSSLILRLDFLTFCFALPQERFKEQHAHLRCVNYSLAAAAAAPPPTSSHAHTFFLSKLRFMWLKQGTISKNERSHVISDSFSCLWLSCCNDAQTDHNTYGFVLFWLWVFATAYFVLIIKLHLELSSLVVTANMFL